MAGRDELEVSASPIVRADARVHALLLRIGTRIRELRTMQGVAIGSVAEAAGLPAALVSRIERGQRNFTIYTASKIADALGVELVDLFGPERSAESATSKGRAAKARARSWGSEPKDSGARRRR